MSIADKTATISANNITIAENVQKVYDAGRQAEYDKFWDSFQKNGEKDNYNYAFYKWANEEGKTTIPTPKYPIKTTSAEYIFYHCTEAEALPDFEGTYVLKEGVASKGEVQVGSYTYAYCYKLKEACAVYMGASSQPYIQIYYCCRSLETIKGDFIFGEQARYTNVFSQCYSLKNISVSNESVIGSNFTISDSPLTLESAKSIISALKDYSATTTTYTLTLSNTTKSYLTDSEIAIATEKGWTVA